MMMHLQVLFSISGTRYSWVHRAKCHSLLQCFPKLHYFWLLVPDFSLLLPVLDTEQVLHLER